MGACENVKMKNAVKGSWSGTVNQYFILRPDEVLSLVFRQNVS